MAYAQPNKPPTGLDLEDQGDDHFKHENYINALEVYKKLVAKESSNLLYNYRLGICYLKTNVKRPEAVKYFEFCIKQPKCENDAWLYLGQAYQYALRFDDAIKAYTTYKQKSPKDAALIDHYIETCNNGKILVKDPIDVTFENPGKDVNSEYADYYPFVTADESFLVFTSRRKGNLGAAQVEFDGYYASDIYMASTKPGAFQKAKNLSAPVNGNYDDRASGLSADGKSLTVYIDNISTAGDLYKSVFTRSWSKPMKMGETINEGFETSGTFSPDSSAFYFASRRDGGQGDMDLWVVRKLPTGKWSKAQNLGATINTQYNEDFPFLDADGCTLYFASQGHNSMGGYDIFKTKLNEEDGSWSNPENLGYPLNTPDDNMTISFVQGLQGDGPRVGYVSAARDGGIGDLDIWRVTFNDGQGKSFTVVSGTVLTPDSTKSLDATITVTNAKTSEDYGTYKPVASTGKYVLALPPGKYTISVDATGYKSLVDTILIFDIASITEMKKDLVLQK